MGAEIVKALLDCLKLRPRYFLVIGVVSGVLLYADAQLLHQIGVDELAKDYRPILGMALIVSCVLLGVAIASAWAAHVRRQWRQWQFDRRIIERLQTLTEEEKQILRFYIAKQSRSNVLRIGDGVVQGLVAAGIIFRSASLGGRTGEFAHNIRDVAWKHLNEQLALLDGETDIYRSDHWRDSLNE